MVKTQPASMASRAGQSDPQADPPIDLDHLDRQTLGDAAIRGEVLDIFQREMAALRSELAATSGEARARLAHRVKGAALGVGAKALAECAAVLQDSPGREDIAAMLAERADEAVRFVAKLHKDGAFWRS